MDGYGIGEGGEGRTIFGGVMGGGGRYNEYKGRRNELCRGTGGRCGRKKAAEGQSLYHQGIIDKYIIRKT